MFKNLLNLILPVTSASPEEIALGKLRGKGIDVVAVVQAVEALAQAAITVEQGQLATKQLVVLPVAGQKVGIGVYAQRVA